MSKILILFAHPALEKSRVQSRLAKQVAHLPNVTFRDLYEEYPDFFIDVRKEQRLLLAHDVIIFQHPFYWYSSPAILKEWMDLVLEHKWAYGTNGTALAGKKWMNAISCGGSKQAYSSAGLNRFSIRDLLAPFDQTAHLCSMEFLPPFVVHGTHRLSEEEIEQEALTYRAIVTALANDSLPVDKLRETEYINGLAPVLQQTQTLL